MSNSCFDLRLASSPTRHVPIRRVVDLLMVTHAPEQVAQYRHAMLSGERFPPVSVLPLCGWFFLTDGHKRFTAYKSLQGTQIPVQVWTIPQSMAHLGRQTLKEASQGCRLVARLGRDPEAGSQLKKFLWSRVVHYRRLGQSLWTRLRP